MWASVLRGAAVQDPAPRSLSLQAAPVPRTVAVFPAKCRPIPGTAPCFVRGELRRAVASVARVSWNQLKDCCNRLPSSFVLVRRFTYLMQLVRQSVEWWDERNTHSCVFRSACGCVGAQSCSLEPCGQHSTPGLPQYDIWGDSLVTYWHRLSCIVYLAANCVVVTVGVCVRVRIILEWNLRKRHGASVWMQLTQTVVQRRALANGNEPSWFTKCGEFLHRLNECQSLSIICTLWSRLINDVRWRAQITKCLGPVAAVCKVQMLRAESVGWWRVHVLQPWNVQIMTALPQRARGRFAGFTPGTLNWPDFSAYLYLVEKVGNELGFV